jgi:cellulose synthase/poly-beta-1,6-N-acetylglucosamine synthase-like glycosyltransferase
MYLPKSPNNIQKFLYLDSGRRDLYSLSALSTILLTVGMILFIKSNPAFVPYLIFSILTIIYLLLTYAVGIFGDDFNFDRHVGLITRYHVPSANEEIDILLPVCNEPIELIRNTWVYVSKLVEAHEGKIKVYVLDDGHSKDVEKLAEIFQFNYIDRGTNELKKAGNLRHSFTKTTAPFFIIFDADFCPRTDFIINVMPYMYVDNSVGIVQSPQFFEVTNELTRVQKGSASVQELFYRLIQVSRDTFDGAICVGSNACYRRSALEQFGGTSAIGFSEDVRTGFRLAAVGGKVKYIPINLAMGTCPENWKSFFTQYYRWSMGSLDLMLSKEFWAKGMSVMQKICYLSGMFYYLTTGLSVIFATIPSIYLLIFHPEYIYWFNLLFSIPSLFLSTVYMKYWQKLPYDLDVLRVRQVSFYAHIYALKDIIMQTAEAWIPTGGTNNSKRYQDFMKFYAFITILTPIITLSMVIYRITQGYNYINFTILVAITIFNAYIQLPVLLDLYMGECRNAESYSKFAKRIWGKINNFKIF